MAKKKRKRTAYQKACGNIDAYTGRVLDQMVARIGAKKAQLYASRHTAQQMRDREDFFMEA